MPSSYPAGYDSFGNPIPNDALDSITLPHATDQHARMNDAIEAVQGALGLDPQGGEATVSARVAAMESDADAALALAEGLFDIIDAKGDIVVGTADNTPGVLSVGPDGWALVADPLEPTGLGWAALTEAEGVGIPPGGTTGQALIKLTDDDYDVDWGNIHVVSGGSVAVLAAMPYPRGGVEGSGEDGCWLTWTDPDTGYVYRIHKWLSSGDLDVMTVERGVIGTLLVVGAGGRGGHYAGGSVPGNAGAGGGGAVYEQPYAFGVGTHVCYVGRGANNTLANAETTKFDDVWAYGGGNGGSGGNFSSGSPGTDGGNGGGGGKGLLGVEAGGAATYGSIDAGATTDTTLFDAEAGSNGTSGEGGGSEWTSGISGTDVTYSYGGLRDGSPAEWDDNTGSGGHSILADGPDGKDGIIYARYRIA